MMSPVKATIFATAILCSVGCSALRPATPQAQSSPEPATKPADVSGSDPEVAYLALAIPSQKYNKITHLNAFHSGVVPQLQTIPIGKSGVTLGEVTERLNTHYEAVRLLDYRRRSPAEQTAYMKEAATSVLKFVVIRKSVESRVDDYFIPFQMVTNGIACFVQVEPRDIVRIEFVSVQRDVGNVPVGSPPGTESTISVSVEGRVKRPGAIRIVSNSSLNDALGGQMPDGPTIPDIVVVHRVDKSTRVSQHFLLDYNGAFRAAQSLDLARRALILKEQDRIAMLYTEEIPLLQNAVIVSQAIFVSE